MPCPLLEQHLNEYEQIGEEITYRLGQRPAVYEVLKYFKVIKKIEIREIISTPAPSNVFERSQYDVSTLLLIIKLQLNPKQALLSAKYARQE